MYPKLLIIIRNNQFCVQDTTFSQFRFKKGQKTEFYDPEIVTADNKNAIETPFLVVSRPQKGMGGITIGFQEKSNFFSSISLDLGVKIAVFPQGGRLTPPPTADRVKIIRKKILFLSFFQCKLEGRVLIEPRNANVCTAEL